MVCCNRKWLVPVLTLALVSFTGALLAQEHPEHPQKKAEHPEDPKGKAAGVTKEELGEAIEKYIQGEMAKGGGTWNVEDPAEKATLSLTLDRVHKDKLAQTAKDTYFACADLKNPGGSVYDLDVFMKGPDKDSLKVTEVSVHKKDGKERYMWKEESGVWKKQPVGKAAEHPKEHPEGGEHPEHPEDPEL